mmetsp:Transcript_50481/g.110402  ORF Transcript_50481/g.110402 Transcript_50481/m.110402 type:complete len:258 (-) Transcript_50481:205-978(-)
MLALGERPHHLSCPHIPHHYNIVPPCAQECVRAMRRGPHRQDPIRVAHLDGRVVRPAGHHGIPAAGIQAIDPAGCAAHQDFAPIHKPVHTLRGTILCDGSLLLPQHLDSLQPRAGDCIAPHRALAVTRGQAPCSTLLAGLPTQASDGRSGLHRHLRSVPDSSLDALRILVVVYVVTLDQLALGCEEPQTAVHIPSRNQLIIRRPPHIEDLHGCHRRDSELPVLGWMQNLLVHLEDGDCRFLLLGSALVKHGLQPGPH